MQLPEEVRRPSTAIASDAVLIIGGALMVIGSFSPWTHGTIGYASSTPFTVYRNGMELGFKGGFSIAGLITVLSGAAGALSGSLRLAGRHPPRLLAPAPLLYGIVGLAVGLYAAGEAAWYTFQMTQDIRPSLRRAPASGSGCSSPAQARTSYSGCWRCRSDR